MEHLTDSELRAFLERHLPPDRLLQVDDHLAGCTPCRAALEREVQAGAAIAGLQDEFAAVEAHLEYEQLLCVVEGRGVPTEVDRHLAHCSSCTNEMEVLRKFVTETRETPRSFHVLQPEAVRKRVEPRRMGLTWIGMAAAVLLAVGAGLYWRSALQHPRRDDKSAGLRDGDFVLSLDKSGQLHGAEGLRPDQQRALRTVLTTGRLAVEKSSEFTANGQETLLGASHAAPLFKVISPINRVVVDDKPRFAWEPMAGATGYRVRVYAAGYKKIAESPLLHETDWQSSTALQRGEVYSFTVTAESVHGEVLVPAPPQPEAKFRVVDAGAAAEISNVERSRGTDHLLLAVLYAQSGALDEARSQVDLLAVQNPLSPLVAQLRASLLQSADVGVPSPIRTNAAQ